MKIHELPTLEYLPPSTTTLGTFDGIHLGHQKIIRRIVELSRTLHTTSVLITFHPHPRSLIQSTDNQKIELLTPLEEKLKLVATLGIENTLIIPFTREFSELSAEEFVQKILIEKTKTKSLIIGYDHHFGKNREGNIAFLRKNSEIFPFQIEEIRAEEIQETIISSSKIRVFLKSGRVAEAEKLLGRKYDLTGLVIKGKQLGRQLGFPTANISLNPEKLLPAFGVYACYVTYHEKRYNSLLNIGYRPTVEGKGTAIEAHILDFEQEIYGEFLKIELIHRLREERKFATLELLKNQIKEDIQRALIWF